MKRFLSLALPLSSSLLLACVTAEEAPPKKTTPGMGGTSGSVGGNKVPATMGGNSGNGGAMVEPQPGGGGTAGRPAMSMGGMMATGGAGGSAAPKLDGGTMSGGTGGTPAVGTPDAGGGSANCPAMTLGCGAGSYFPMAVGNKWTYTVREGVDVTEKAQTVLAMEAVGGTGPSKAVMAFKLETKKVGGVGAADHTISWQGVEGTRVVRYRETSFTAGTNTVDVEDHWAPPRLRVPAAAPAMMMWMETYKESKQEFIPTLVKSECDNVEQWSVLGVDVKVTVLNKAYNVLQLRKKAVSSKCGNMQLQPGTSDKTYWFARGVGKVKETPSAGVAGAGQIEELKDFMVK